jgi:hypothetical protein
MKVKTINKVIEQKVNDWLETIEDEKLRRDLKNNIIITGGSIVSMLLKEPVNDFDIYFKNKDITKRVAEYYCKVFNDENQNSHAWVLDGEDVQSWKEGNKKLTEFAHGYKYDTTYQEVKDWNEVSKTDEKDFSKVSGMILNTTPDRIKVMINSKGIAENDEVADEVEYDIDEYINIIDNVDDISSSELEAEDRDKKKYIPIFLSTNAITLSDKMQLILRFYGTPKEIHENFDFIHATNYWTNEEGVVTNTKALESILSKTLVYMGSKYPITSLIRSRKFIKRDWSINAGQYLKMAMQISELNLKDIYVLEDQLVGVDSIYFLQFIHNIMEKQENDPNFEIKSDYVTSVIDKIFD